MSRTIKSVLFGLLLCTGFISCEKEYSIENGVGGPVSNGTAVYTFDGAPNACTSPVVNGTYKLGSPLGASNTVVLSVNVVTAGTYTVSTSVVNGVSFTATSSFSGTGAQIIQLTGKGTPTAAGTFSYKPGNGCAFSITFSGAGGTSTGTAVYTCTSLTANGTYTQGSTLGSSNTLVLKVNVTTAGTYTITTGPNDGITFSGNGNLVAGAQTITLAGTGTPVEPGPATFSFGTGTTGCSVNINVIAAGGGTTGTQFLKCTIDGVAYEFNNNITTIYQAGTPGQLPIDGNLSSSTGSDDFSINFITITSAITANTDYKNFLTTMLVDKSILVIYNDNADTWQSSGTMANSFTSHLSTLTSTGATGTFSGTLYNNDGNGPAKKVITLGSFSVTF